MKFIAMMVGIGSVALALCVEVSDGKLTVVNRSNRTLVFTYGDEYAGDSLHKEPPYAIDLEGRPLFTATDGQDQNTTFVLPLATKSMWANGYWEHIFRNDTVSRGKTSAYLLDADTVRKYSWSTIRRKGLFLARFAYSQRDLEQRGWRMVYSGEAMHGRQIKPKSAEGHLP